MMAQSKEFNSGTGAKPREGRSSACSPSTASLSSPCASLCSPASSSLSSSSPPSSSTLAAASAARPVSPAAASTSRCSDRPCPWWFVGVGSAWMGRCWPPGNARYHAPTPKEIDESLRHFVALKPSSHNRILLDTASGYGRAEERVGQWLKDGANAELASNFVILTKFGEVFDVATGETKVDLSPTAASAQLAVSIERLGRVDIFCSHVTSQLTAEQARAVYANDQLRSLLQAAKKRGAVALLGTSCSHPQVLEAALDAGELDGLIDVVQMAAKSFRENPRLVSKLHQRGVKLILNSLIRGRLSSSSAELSRAEVSSVLDDTLGSHQRAHTVLIGSRDVHRRQWLAKQVCDRSARGGRLRVVMAQLKVHVGAPAKNVGALVECMERNAAAADLVVAPECFVSGYGSAEAVSCCEPADGPSFQALSEAAKNTGLAVVYGFCERATSGRKYISLNWISSDGELLFTYRKTHLWTTSPFESSYFTCGTSLAPVVSIAGVAVGCMICFDVEVTEPSRHLALSGAQLLIAIGCNTSSFTLDTLIRVRAFENQCHVIYVNQCNAPYRGGSVAVDPTGTFCGPPLAICEPGEACVTIEPQHPKFSESLARNPLFRTRQPRLYNLNRDRSSFSSDRAS